MSPRPRRDPGPAPTHPRRAEPSSPGRSRSAPAAALAAGLFALLVAAGDPAPAAAQGGDPDPGSAAAGDTASEITASTLRQAEKLSGLSFTDDERGLILSGETPFVDVTQLREAYRALRASSATRNDLGPALVFRPEPPRRWPEEAEPELPAIPSDPRPEVRRPEDLEDAAFWPVRKLAELVRTGQVTSVELTQMYLDRVERHDPTLRAVITLTREHALARARRMDRELDEGRYRGPLHGIPYAAKDLFAVPGHPTTWGAAPYRDRVIDDTAAAVARLDSAGGVLVAKTTLGALAWGDVWFGGRTRNPWDPEEGSSGSSAGSAAAVSAGLVPVALGTETLGSLVSPATRTGVSALRPSFGRVGRSGAMVVAWSMDKVGPLCRYVEDCALVFEALRGHDPDDRTTVRDVGFPYDSAVDLSSLEVAYLASAFEEDYPGAEQDREALDVLRRLGADLRPLELPDLPVGATGFVLGAEAATAHDELTRSDGDTLLVRQGADAWPNVFRSSRFIPAVEYLQANQVRRAAGIAMARELEDVDVYVAPSFQGGNLLLTNLTGHPCVAVPDGFVDGTSPTSITFCGRMYGEDAALEAARAYQEATGWEEETPPRFTP